VLAIDVIHRSKGDVVVALAGELTADAWDQLRLSLDDPYIDDGVKRIALRLEGLTYLGLDGVAVLIQLYREAEERGKEFTVEGHRAQVRHKLETTGVLRLLSKPTS
jgi:anti-anti-sigma factor